VNRASHNSTQNASAPTQEARPQLADQAARTQGGANAERSDPRLTMHEVDRLITGLSPFEAGLLVARRRISIAPPPTDDTRPAA